MEFNLEDPYYRPLFDAFKSVYNRHDPQAPLNHVNTVEWVEAAVPVIKEIVQDQLLNALHPELGWAHRVDDE